MEDCKTIIFFDDVLVPRSLMQILTAASLRSIVMACNMGRASLPMEFMWAPVDIASPVTALLAAEQVLTTVDLRRVPWSDRVVVESNVSLVQKIVLSVGECLMQGLMGIKGKKERTQKFLDTAIFLSRISIGLGGKCQADVTYHFYDGTLQRVRLTFDASDDTWLGETVHSTQTQALCARDENPLASYN